MFLLWPTLPGCKNWFNEEEVIRLSWRWRKNRPGETKTGNRGEQKEMTLKWDKHMMNTLKRKVKSAYTKKNNKTITENSRSDGVRVLCNFKCFMSMVFFPPTDCLCFFQLRTQKYSALCLPQAQLFKKTYLTWISDVCFPMKSVRTYLCFSNTGSIDVNWLTNLKSAKAV